MGTYTIDCEFGWGLISISLLRHSCFPRCALDQGRFSCSHLREESGWGGLNLYLNWQCGLRDHLLDFPFGHILGFVILYSYFVKLLKLQLTSNSLENVLRQKQCSVSIWVSTFSYIYLTCYISPALLCFQNDFVFWIIKHF